MDKEVLQELSAFSNGDEDYLYNFDEDFQNLSIEDEEYSRTRINPESSYAVSDSDLLETEKKEEF